MKKTLLILLPLLLDSMTELCHGQYNNLDNSSTPRINRTAANKKPSVKVGAKNPDGKTKIPGQDGAISIKEAGKNKEKVYKGIYVMIKDSKPSEVLVYNKNGKWFSEAREIVVKFDIEKRVVKGEITYWKGPIRPKNPLKILVEIQQLKSATDEVFMKKLDELNRIGNEQNEQK